MSSWLSAVVIVLIQTSFHTVQPTTTDGYNQVCNDPKTCSGGGLKAPRSFNCVVHLRSYSAYDPCEFPSNCDENVKLPGYVTLNERMVWQAGWLSKKIPNRRGINTMIVNPVDCTASGIRRFDTFFSAENAKELVDYLDLIRQGAIVVGVTGDEPTKHLRPALRKLRALGVDVGDVPFRGSFVFVLQIGYPEKNVYNKVTYRNEAGAQIRVTLTGNTEENLQFRVIDPDIDGDYDAD